MIDTDAINREAHRASAARARVQCPRAWNSRYVQWARALGVGPRLAASIDHAYGFISWIDARWLEWARETGHPRARNANAAFAPVDHASFDRWLPGRVDALLREQALEIHPAVR